MRFYKSTSTDDDAASANGNAPVATSLTDRASIAQRLAQALGDVPGTLGLALVDPDAGEILGTAARGVDMSVVATLHIDLCRAASRIGDAVSGSGGVENLALTLAGQHQLILPLRTIPTIWICLVLDRQRGNVALARHQLSKIEDKLTA